MSNQKQAPAKTQEEVEARTEQWHQGDGAGMELHEYLGWSQDQYAKFVETGKLPDFDLRSMNS